MSWRKPFLRTAITCQEKHWLLRSAGASWSLTIHTLSSSGTKVFSYLLRKRSGLVFGFKRRLEYSMRASLEFDLRQAGLVWAFFDLLRRKNRGATANDSEREGQIWDRA